jgi:hypothetical protein
MNDSELDKRLKSVPLPDRPEAYWDEFPFRVRGHLRCAAVKPEAEGIWLPRLAWAGGCALALIFCLWCAHSGPVQTVADAIAHHGSHIRREFAQFETKLHVLMRDEHGLHQLIVENE